MGERNRLFNDSDLDDWLQRRLRAVAKVVDDWHPDEFLATAGADIEEYLVAEHSVICPTIQHARIEQLPFRQGTATGLVDGPPPFYWWGVVAVPFEGDAEVFRLRPNQCPADLALHGLINGSELQLVWITSELDPSCGAAAVHRLLKVQIDAIEQLLTNARAAIDRHNTSVRELAEAAVMVRMLYLRCHKELQSEISFPVRTRADAAKYVVPVNRRTISPRPEPDPGGATIPAPVLPDLQYEAALDVLINMRNALERSPSTTAKLTEEGIRDLLLVALNAQFEGKAAGEVFNGAGKTDILIRVEDRNVFIAECKIWKGPKAIRDALDQLMSYLVWRDTKAALLVFIRSGEPSAVIKKVAAEIEQHPNCRRAATQQQPGERYDYVLHAHGDSSQEIRLAFLPFALEAGDPNG